MKKTYCKICGVLMCGYDTDICSRHKTNEMQTNKEILQEIEKKHAHPPMMLDSMIFEAMDAARRDEREKLTELPENIDIFMISAEMQGWIFHLGMWIKEGYETRTTEQLYGYLKFDKN